MVIRRNEMQTETKEKLRGGDGAAVFTHFVEGGSQKNVRLAAEIKLPPGASIGCHRHDGETEYFIFTEGSGTVSDNGTELAVGKGDVMVTGDGASHSVTNSGAVPLVFTAFIVTREERT
jgi:mannose-6-phosphate isomerase-like protein (cupin superfamily)